MTYLRHGLVILLVGCLTPTEPEGLEPYEPLPAYGRWYRELERCAEIQGPPLWAIEFWQLPHATTIETADTTLAAYFEQPRRVVVAGFYVTSRPLIEHELLHVLLQDDPHHKSPLFRRCVG